MSHQFKVGDIVTPKETHSEVLATGRRFVVTNIEANDVTMLVVKPINGNTNYALNSKCFELVKSSDKKESTMNDLNRARKLYVALTGATDATISVKQIGDNAYNAAVLAPQLPDYQVRGCDDAEAMRNLCSVLYSKLEDKKARLVKELDEFIEVLNECQS